MKFKLCLLTCLLCALSLFAAKKVVVVEKIKSNSATELSPTRLEMLQNRIADGILNSQKFELVERDNLDAFLREQALEDSGMAEDFSDEDEDDEEEDVGVTVAGYVIYGSVLRCEASMQEVEMEGVTHKNGSATIELLIKIGDCKSTKILASKKKSATVRVRDVVTSSVTSTRNLEQEAFEEAAKKVSIDVVNALTDIAYPVKILKIGKRDMTVNLARELTAEGAIYEVYEVGEVLMDPDTNEPLDTDDELIGRVKVTRCRAKTARCVPMDDLTLDDFETGMVLRRVEEESVVVEKKNSRTRKRSLRDNL